MPFSIRKTPDHEVIEVSMPRPYQPYDHLVLRDAPAGRTTWTVLDCERQGEAWQVIATRCLESCGSPHGRPHDILSVWRPTESVARLRLSGVLIPDAPEGVLSALPEARRESATARNRAFTSYESQRPTGES